MGLFSLTKNPKTTKTQKKKFVQQKSQQGPPDASWKRKNPSHMSVVFFGKCDKHAKPPILLEKKHISKKNKKTEFYFQEEGKDVVPQSFGGYIFFWSIPTFSGKRWMPCWTSKTRVQNVIEKPEAFPDVIDLICLSSGINACEKGCDWGMRFPEVADGWS